MLVLAASALAGCSSPEGGDGYVAAADPNLHTYVSNQSFDQPTADIRVRLDGADLFDGDADVESQHNWMLREAKIGAGTHTIDALERDTGTTAKKSFGVPSGGHRWIVVNYWNDGSGSEPRFTIEVHEEPVAFA